MDLLTFEASFSDSLGNISDKKPDLDIESIANFYKI